jgi:hypothetical protein
VLTSTHRIFRKHLSPSCFRHSSSCDVPTPTPRSTDLPIHYTFREADFTYHSEQQCAARCKGSNQRKQSLNRLPQHQVLQSCFWAAVFPILKMCRWFAYISPTEPCLLSDVLITPANSISKQCSEHYLPKLLPHKKDKDLDHTSDELLRMRNSLLNMDGLGVACTLNLLTFSGLLQGHFHIPPIAQSFTCEISSPSAANLGHIYVFEISNISYKLQHVADRFT